jgi:ABC-type amino acid transport substrate-binding protein
MVLLRGVALVLALSGPLAGSAVAEDPGTSDLAAVKARGVLRHLGIRYANFVTGGGDGFDVELMQQFATTLGVRYEFVETDWPAVIPDLVGRQVSASATDLAATATAPVRGDVIATGLTVLPWRSRVVAFSSPVFPTQVWVVARADARLEPIKPSGDLERDIAAVRALLDGRELLGVAATCLDPKLYALEKTRARLVLKQVRLDEVAPLLINGQGQLALLDVADAMIALQKWAGQLKVIGPISARQEMAVAFRRDAPELKGAFEAYLREAHRSGAYAGLVKKYFPEAPIYFREFFARAR